MKKIYLLLFVLLVFFLILLSISFIDIPSPSKLISEDYQLGSL